MGVSTSLKMNAEKPGLRALASAEIPNLSITACCLVIENPRRQGRRASSPVVWWIWRFFRGCDLPLPSWGFALPGDQRGSAGPAAQARPVESTRKHTQKRPEEANKKTATLNGLPRSCRGCEHAITNHASQRHMRRRTAGQANNRGVRVEYVAPRTTQTTKTTGAQEETAKRRGG